MKTPATVLRDKWRPDRRADGYYDALNLETGERPIVCEGFAVVDQFCDRMNGLGPNRTDEIGELVERQRARA